MQRIGAVTIRIAVALDVNELFMCGLCRVYIVNIFSRNKLISPPLLLVLLLQLFSLVVAIASAEHSRALMAVRTFMDERSLKTRLLLKARTVCSRM
jgi:hypothetical protein